MEHFFVNINCYDWCFSASTFFLVSKETNSNVSFLNMRITVLHIISYKTVEPQSCYEPLGKVIHKSEMVKSFTNL